jgi:unsaturated chondroitin disaccharide hydrolase
MKTPRLPLLVAALLTLATVWTRAAEQPIANVIRDSLDFAAAQYGKMGEQLKGQEGAPRSWEKGNLRTVGYKDWTSGFYAGSLWYLFEATGDTKWRDTAAAATKILEEEKNNLGTHDVGFVLYCSYGNGLRLTGNSAYREVLLTGAKSLSTRFNPTVGSIKSWDGRPQWPFPVIVDNMMNLELLMWAAKAGKEPKFAEIATTHADTTLRNHFRPDNSSYHVVDYDPADGKIRSRVTHQGAADNSAWARGQAWGLYGYTMMHRETGKPEYLAQAKKIAAFIINHPRLPADKVPYWDFDAPGIPNVPRDSSAAAIMSSALLELRKFVDAETAKGYTALAEQQIRSLSSPAYRAKLGENGCFILMHATGNHPQGGEIDVPITYGDYYFIEALLRAKAGLERKPTA